MSTYTALYIPADTFREFETVELEHGLRPIYQKLNISYLEILPTGNPKIEIIADEEAALYAEPQINHRATNLCLELFSAAGINYSVKTLPQIYGDVLITGGVNEEGVTQSLAPETQQKIKAHLQSLTRD